MRGKVLFTLILSIALLVPSLAEAKGFSGGSRSSFSSGSRASNFSSRSSSTSRSVSLSKTPRTSTKPSSTKTKSFSGSTSTNTTSKRSGSFSGRTSTVTGKTYTSRSTRSYYNGRYVSVNHYYHAGYSPGGWFGYYDGFTTGMFMGSMFHPWGGTYYVGGHYANYGSSPLAWIIDVIILLILIAIVIAIIKAASSKKIYTRRF